MKHLKPHTEAWFDALESCNPQQAAMTRQILQLAGQPDACSVCGEHGGHDYKVTGTNFSREIGATIRLCGDCREIRTRTQGESYVEFDPGSEVEREN
jgi:hypothetical protein